MTKVSIVFKIIGKLVVPKPHLPTVNNGQLSVIRSNENYFVFFLKEMSVTVLLLSLVLARHRGSFSWPALPHCEHTARL